jgi:RNA polymerase sigma-70 factor, ECF subfamily
MQDGPSDDDKRAKRSELEASVRETLNRQDERAACALAIEGFGPEIYGFMLTMSRTDDLAQESFSRFCEDVVRGIRDFKWNSSLRTWLYTLARHACHRTRRNVVRGRLQLNDPSFAQLEAQVRSQTAPFLRTEAKDAIRDLRAELTDDERELLVLRVDRDLSWVEIAQVYLDADVADGQRVAREAAACRKRFERAKQRLRELAVRRGLMPDKSS